MKALAVVLTMALMVVATVMLLHQIIPALIDTHDLTMTFIGLGLLVMVPVMWYHYLTFIMNFMRGHYD